MGKIETKQFIFNMSFSLPTWITITDGVNIYEPHKKLIEELTDSKCAHFTTSL